MVDTLASACISIRLVVGIVRTLVYTSSTRKLLASRASACLPFGVINLRWDIAYTLVGLSCCFCTAVLNTLATDIFLSRQTAAGLGFWVICLSDVFADTVLVGILVRLGTTVVSLSLVG